MFILQLGNKFFKKENSLGVMYLNIIGLNIICFFIEIMSLMCDSDDSLSIYNYVLKE